MRWAMRGLVWAALLLGLGVLTVGVLLPRTAGATPYTVLTGSMRPDYPPGTLVVVRPVEPDDIAVGDVITYQRESGEAAVVTHRVKQVSINTVTQEYLFTTQGDANADPDTAPVHAVQIRGELWYAAPYLGYASTWISGRDRAVLVEVVAGGLALYAGWMVLGAVRQRRQPTPLRPAHTHGGGS